MRSPCSARLYRHAARGLRPSLARRYPNVGKRGGAYSSGIARPHPYVLLNQTDDLDSQFTIAHEMGHAMHSYLSCKHQPVCTSDYVIFVAEVASTCNEVLLMRHLLRKSTDRRERAYLINHFLDQFKGTVYRQTIFYQFERELGRMAERGETLTADALDEKYLALNRLYFGPDMVSDAQIALEWARIPHFYYITMCSSTPPASPPRSLWLIASCARASLPLRTTSASFPAAAAPTLSRF